MPASPSCRYPHLFNPPFESYFVGSNCFKTIKIRIFKHNVLGAYNRTFSLALCFKILRPLENTTPGYTTKKSKKFVVYSRSRGQGEGAGVHEGGGCRNPQGGLHIMRHPTPTWTLAAEVHEHQLPKVKFSLPKRQRIGTIIRSPMFQHCQKGTFLIFKISFPFKNKILPELQIKIFF